MNNFSSGSGWTCATCGVWRARGTNHHHETPQVVQDITAFDDPEVQAMSLVYQALKDLSPEAQVRVLDWATMKVDSQNTHPRPVAAITFDNLSPDAIKKIVDAVEKEVERRFRDRGWPEGTSVGTGVGVPPLPALAPSPYRATYR